MLRNWVNIVVFIIALPFFFALSLAGWRVDNFLIFNGAGDLVLSATAANGNKFTTRYIHSVELTPIEDEYRIVDGKIWMWEERVRSSGAGLPSMRPKNGRFLASGGWLIYQGSRNPVSQYYYRIGNQYFGLNQADFAPFGRKDFYKIYTGEKLLVKVEAKSLFLARPYAEEKLANAPVNASPVMRGE